MNHVFDERRYLIPFRSTLLPQIFVDTLVIGAGVAGLRAAIAASAHGEVIVLAKTELKISNTSWAQGGIAGVLDSKDTFDDHARDTMTAGAGLCDADAVRLVVEHGPKLLHELISWGMNLDHDKSGALSLGLEGGHSRPRIIHSGGDATGHELARCLLAKAKSITNIRLFEKCFALDLITAGATPGAPVMGAITWHPKHGLQMIWSKATILAGGGAGVVFRETTNPPSATGDGMALAYRAGASLADMAFMQFHPTTLYLPGAHRSLISEAVRGEGAHLLDASKRRFMVGVHPLAELAPRDIVSQAIVRQIAAQGGRHVWLDCRHIPNFKDRFPSIAEELSRFDLDPATDLIPVHPAAHYMVGGVRADLSGRTDVPGLYGVGEVASNGLHGANRLASNSLLEGLVSGEVAGRMCEEMKTGAPEAWRTSVPHAPIPVVSDIRLSDHGELDLADVRSSLRSAMWRNVGVERTGAKLRDVADMLDFWGRYTLDKIFDEPMGWETQNMLLVAAVMARSALWREESRGCHARTDFPEQVEALRVHDLWRRGEAGPRTIPVRGEAPLVAPVADPSAGLPVSHGTGARP
ncbi:MAG: L-aspartate oxidase [Phycisphaerales bacterium]|jgi:L-aspartate oxidase|nr:L-aspartate oxidase [Phycisphaerales bacterium]